MATLKETTLNERYVLVEEIGRGGMGVVYKGKDRLLEREVAIKLLSREQLGSGGVERLLNEARIIARLDHTNIVSIYDAGQTGDTPFIVMQLVKGKTLAEYCPLTLEDSISIAIQISSALAHAHANGVVHRDLKPENVFLLPSADSEAEGQQIKIVDFGIAHSDLASLTIQGEISGTVSYMAPEQALGEQISPQTDLYALGVMLYEMLTGELPYRGENPLSVISQHINASIEVPSQKNPEIPSELDALIVRLMSKSPADRPASAQEVEHILSEQLHLQTVAEFIPAGKMRKHTVRHNLPLQLTSFVGRQQELSQINHLLGEDSCRLLSLIGPGGIGKTRLAIEAAMQLRNRFLDGVFFIPLTAIPAPDFILPAIAEALDFSLHTLEDIDPENQFLNYIEKRNLLLVLDNYEHLVDGMELLIDILENAPEVKLLVTSRQKLNVQGEWIFEVPGLEFPKDGSQAGVTGCSAIDLFVERARSADTRFQIEDEEIRQVIRICQLVDGIPLGIELASAWVSVLSPHEIANEIEKNLDFLASSMHNIPEKHHSMRAVFEYSSAMIPEEQQDLFIKLSVFRGGFDRQAAAEIAGASLKDLSLLVDKSFIRRNNERFEIHELLRQYGQELLQVDEAKFSEIKKRHADYFLNLLKRHKAGISGEKQLEIRDEIQADIENVRAAIIWGISVKDERGVYDALGILMEFYLLQGYYEGVKTYHNFARVIDDQFQPGFDPVNPGSLIYLTALTYQIFFLSMLGTIEISEDLGSKILPGLRYLGIDKEIEFCLMSQGINCIFRGEYNRGEEFLKEALQIGGEIEDFVGLIGSNIWLGWIYYEQGDCESARKQWEDSQVISSRTKNRLMLAFAQSKLALIHHDTGDYENAIKLQLYAREIFKLFGDQVGIGYATSRLALSLIGIGDWREAKRMGQESYRSFKAMNHSWGIPASLCRIGFAEIELEEYSLAWMHLDEALNLSKESQIGTLVLYALVGLSKLLSWGNKSEQGVKILSFVVADPTTPSLYRRLAEESLVDIENNIPPEDFSLLQQIGEKLSLEEVLGLLPSNPFEPLAEITT